MREAAKHPVGLMDANRPLAPPARAAGTNAADSSSDDDHVRATRPIARMSGGGPYVISGATLRAGAADMDISSSDGSSEESSEDSDSSDSDDDASPGQAAMRASRMSVGGMAPRMQLASRLLAPAASRARQTARMSTGGRAPRPVAARRVIPDDANENSDDIEVLSVSVLGPSAAPQPEPTAPLPPPGEQPKQDVTPPVRAFRSH